MQKLLKSLSVPTKNSIRGQTASKRDEGKESSDLNSNPTATDIRLKWPGNREISTMAHTDSIDRAPIDDRSNLRSTTRIPMMQTTDLWNCNHFAVFGRFNFTRLGRVAIEREMSTRFVVILNIIGQDSTKMRFAKYDHVIQAFSPNCPDGALPIWILLICQLHLIVTLRSKLIG